MPAISAVLIVKNEEKLLGRCLRSLAGLDEIVVLDTGSTDRTMRIAKDLGANVSEEDCSCPPEGEAARRIFGEGKRFHFAKARNRALEIARHPWILSIDADEVLRPGGTRKIRTAIDGHAHSSAFNITFVNRAENNPSKTTEIRKIKIFRKDAWTWKYRVHELLFPLRQGVHVQDLSQVVIEHLPDEDKAARHGQNLDLLRLCVEESPEYVRARRHLGQEFMLRKEYSEAIPELARYAEKTDEAPIERSQALLWIAKCYAEMGRLEDAVRWFELSHGVEPRRREPLYFAAWYLANRGPTLEHVDRAVRFLERALEIPVSARPGSHLDEIYVWIGEPGKGPSGFGPSETEKLLAKCRRAVAETVEASRKGQA